MQNSKRMASCKSGITSLVVFFVLCSAGVAQHKSLEAVPGVPERYWFLYEPNWPVLDDAIASARKGLPFQTISLQRIGGLGPPSYTITFQRDGTAHFDGGEFARRKGQFKGSIALEDYGRLCFIIERLKLNSLNEDVRKEKVHGSHGFATIVRATKVGEDKPLENWEVSANGPVELWAIQLSIDAIADRIDWKPDQRGKGK